MAGKSLLCVIVAALFAAGAVPAGAAGTGMMWQVPHEPTGKFAEPGPPGLCQCINDNSRFHAMCLPSAPDCHTQCGKVYAYMPDARQSCATPHVAMNRRKLTSGQ